jgi:hypothetical protein
MRFLLPSAAMAFALGSCVAPKPAPPAPQPPVATAPPPAVSAVVQPQGAWLDWPLSQGSWVYRRDDRGSIALYGTPGADALVMLRCDKGRRVLFLSRAGVAASGMTVRTSFSLKSLSAQATGGQPPYVASEIALTDPILDAMAYSRGRIAIEAGGLQSIAIPVWSEIGRVVEDCRA